MTAPSITPEPQIFRTGHVPPRPVRLRYPLRHHYQHSPQRHRSKSHSSLEGMLHNHEESSSSSTFCDSSLSSSWTSPHPHHAAATIHTSNSSSMESITSAASSSPPQDFKLVATILYEQEAPMEEREDAIMDEDDLNHETFGPQPLEQRMGNEEEHPEDTAAAAANMNQETDENYDNVNDADSDTQVQHRGRRIDSSRFFLSREEPYYLMIPTSALMHTGDF